MTKILALTGGVGGAKLALGLAQILPPEQLLFAVNTGDDFEHLGLHISPDIDSLTYALAQQNNTFSLRRPILRSLMKGSDRTRKPYACSERYTVAV